MCLCVQLLFFIVMLAKVHHETVKLLREGTKYIKNVWNLIEVWVVFTALHGMQTQSSDENCLSVNHVICDKTKESCARILIPAAAAPAAATAAAAVVIFCVTAAY